MVIDHINLRIEKGKIYGFIGQNGAGKTTFLRLTAGLSFPTDGTLELWGQRNRTGLQEQRKRMGCLIESPALYPNLTAVQNLEVQRLQRGIPGKSVISDCLRMTGLTDTAKTRSETFPWE